METLYTSISEEDTSEIAANFAQTISAPALICLYGTLGAGKSVFARSFIRALCEDNSLEVPSPTFTLVQSYEADSCPLYHYDLYRIKQAQEIYELGWEDALDDAITLVEWPERLDNLKPPSAIDIHINIAKDEAQTRTIKIIEG
ncbi:MAG: tRNA (adenosine(37)-N6)-threonylcarbamoyltransferase complex ATPase subunit type 1 TsaE [Alphaproteobacteria bacterium]